MECELTYAPSAAGALFGPRPSEQHAEWPQTTEGGQCSARLWLSGGQTRMLALEEEITEDGPCSCASVLQTSTIPGINKTHDLMADCYASDIDTAVRKLWIHQLHKKIFTACVCYDQLMNSWVMKNMVEEYELSKSWQDKQRIKWKETDWMWECVYKNAWDKLETTTLICQDQELWWSVLTTKLYRGSIVKMESKLSANMFEWKFFSLIFKDNTIKTNDSDNKHTNWSKWKLENSHTWVLAFSCWPELLNHTQRATLLMSNLMTQIK